MARALITAAYTWDVDLEGVRSDYPEDSTDEDLLAGEVALIRHNPIMWLDAADVAQVDGELVSA